MAAAWQARSSKPGTHMSAHMSMHISAHMSTTYLHECLYHIPARVSAHMLLRPLLLLGAWVQLRAGQRFATLTLLWLSSFLASYRGVGVMCLSGLLGLHASSLARQSLLSMVVQARKVLSVLYWPFARIWLFVKSRMEWVWDFGFELVRQR